MRQFPVYGLMFVSLVLMTLGLSQCGVFVAEDNDDDQTTETFDGRIPADWSGAEDWPGNAFEVVDE